MPGFYYLCDWSHHFKTMSKMRRILNYIMIAISMLGFVGCDKGGKRGVDRLWPSEYKSISPIKGISV